MANGIFGGGNGTEATPYLIEDADDLNAIRKDLSAYYRLVNDINLNVEPYNTGYGWDPIDDFTGQLDGDGYTIGNLYINRPLEDNVGLFGVSTLTILDISLKNNYTYKNIVLDNVNIKGKSNTGSLCGISYIYHYNYPAGSWIPCFANNIFCSGYISGESHVGGCFGSIYSYKGLFDNGDQGWAGVYSKMTYIITKCKIKSNTNILGGIVGYCSGVQVDIGGYYGHYTWSTNFGMSNCLSLCEYLTTYSTISINGNIPLIENFYYDKKILGNITQTYGTGLSGNINDLYNIQTFINMAQNIISTSGKRMIKYINGLYPTTNNFQYCIIKIDNIYYTYKNDTWKQIASDITEDKAKQIKRELMFDLKEIPAETWTELKRSNKKVSVLNMVPQLNTFSLKDVTNTIPYLTDYDTTNHIDNKYVMKKTFNFEDYANEISQITAS